MEVNVSSTNYVEWVFYFQRISDQKIIHSAWLGKLLFLIKITQSPINWSIPIHKICLLYLQASWNLSVSRAERVGEQEVSNSVWAFLMIIINFANNQSRCIYLYKHSWTIIILYKSLLCLIIYIIIKRYYLSDKLYFINQTKYIICKMEKEYRLSIVSLGYIGVFIKRIRHHIKKSKTRKRILREWYETELSYKLILETTINHIRESIKIKFKHRLSS